MPSLDHNKRPSGDLRDSPRVRMHVERLRQSLDAKEAGAQFPCEFVASGNGKQTASIEL